MKTRTDFHGVNLSSGARTRSVVGDGQRLDETVAGQPSGVGEPPFHQPQGGDSSNLAATINLSVEDAETPNEIGAISITITGVAQVAVAMEALRAAGLRTVAPNSDCPICKSPSCAHPTMLCARMRARPEALATQEEPPHCPNCNTSLPDLDYRAEGATASWAREVGEGLREAATRDGLERAASIVLSWSNNLAKEWEKSKVEGVVFDPPSKLAFSNDAKRFAAEMLANVYTEIRAALAAPAPNPASPAEPDTLFDGAVKIVRPADLRNTVGRFLCESHGYHTKSKPVSIGTVQDLICEFVEVRRAAERKPPR